MADQQLRWELADDRPQGELFEPIVEREFGRGEFRGMEFLHVNARRIINEIKGEARFGFSYTINAYRGCSHACGYCFARPTHSYLNLGIGEDFERKIVVKVNAVERLRAELHPRRWPGHSIAMGTNTDPYQRCEGKYHLTERIIDVLTEASNPFSILTKSSLILRDVERLAEAVRRTEVGVSLSIGTLDEAVWKLTEPGTPHPRRRVAAVAQLNEAGVPTGVLMGPVIPGLSDDPAQLEDVVRECLEAGAVSIGVVLLHLRPGVKEHFLEQLGKTHPELLERYRRLYPRAYAPKAEQRRVSELVHGLVQKHGGVRVVPRRRAPRIVVPAAPAPAQLSLL